MTAAQLKRHLAEQGDVEIASHALRFFKAGPGEYGEGDKFRGIRVPALRKLAKQHRDLPQAEVLKLLRSGYHEDRLLALLILVLQFGKGDDAEQKRIYDAYLDHTDYVNGWDLVDSSAQHIVGEWLMTRSRKPLYRLARSKSLWERRIAIMATFQFIKQNDFDDTLALADLLLHDEHDLMHKAVGWMLREVGNRDRAVEEAFLLPRYHNMPRTMLRYAIEKFPERKRMQYLKGLV